MERWRGVGEAPPEKARRPLAALETPIAVCQAFTLVRRMGWTIALGPDDSSCPLFNLAMGWLGGVRPLLHSPLTRTQVVPHLVMIFATAARGIRYPIPTNLQYELPFMRLLARFSDSVPD